MYNSSESARRKGVSHSRAYTALTESGDGRLRTNDSNRVLATTKVYGAIRNVLDRERRLQVACELDVPASQVLGERLHSLILLQLYRSKRDDQACKRSAIDSRAARL